jgi:solute carrier family 35 protein F5
MYAVTINGMIGTVLSDVLWAKAIVLTSPLTVNLGMSLTIPLSCLADYINPNSQKPPMQVMHACLSAL